MGPGRNTGLDAILGHRCFAGQSSTVSLFFAAWSASLSHDCAMSRSESLAERSLTRCTPHCRCFRIFDFHPMRRSARAVRRAEPLRHDALAAELAGVLKENVAIAPEDLVEHNAEIRPAHQFC